jgi:hypothetical protein
MDEKKVKKVKKKEEDGTPKVTKVKKTKTESTPDKANGTTSSPIVKKTARSNSLASSIYLNRTN